MGSPKMAKEVLRYGRDYLLQLRMHPLSLRKPQNLPNMEIIKDRLYFHQIDNMASSGVDDSQYHCYTDDMRTFLKHDIAYKRFNQRSSPGYTSRSCGEYASYPKYIPQLSISKYRACYDSPPQKQLYRASSYKTDTCTEDFFENISDFQNVPWFKEAFPQYENENEWNINYKNPENKLQSSTNGSNPKSRKKLSIIDPKTGKNILDGIEESSNSQTSISSKETIEDESKVTVNDGVKYPRSSSNSKKGSFLNGVNNRCKEEDDYAFLSESSKQPSVLNYNLDSSDDELMREYSEYRREVSENGGTSQGLQYDENEKILNLSLSGDKGNIDSASEERMEEKPLHSNDKANEKNSQHITDYKANVLRNGVSENGMSDPVLDNNQEANLKEKIIMLRDKVYSMKQEQQKMAIFQSFLRFKKQQLDESFRSLDDKKMNIINREYNLFTKVKNLREKEYWIESKLKNLRKREKQLDEREKWLNHKEREMRNKYNNVLKREATSNDVAVPLENGESHSDTNKNTSYGGGDQKAIYCFNSLNKDEEILPPKPKEGRKYSPDYGKQWVNQRDKNIENGTKIENQ